MNAQQELYQRLKQRGVLVAPGQNVIVGIGDDWNHKHQCLRATYAQHAHVVRRGVELIAEEVRAAYEQ